MPLISVGALEKASLSLGEARGYGHRGNLHWALRCETCLMQALGRRYGERERAALQVDGWVHEARYGMIYGYIYPEP